MLASSSASEPRPAHGLSCACAALIGFQGVCHETVGAIVFPFGPRVFGGPLGWHAFGLGIIAVGAWLTAATALRRTRFVIPASAATTVLALTLFTITAAVFARFHVFALTATLAALGLSACEVRLARAPTPPTAD